METTATQGLSRRLRQPVAVPPFLSVAGDRVTAAVVLAVAERRFFLLWALGVGLPLAFLELQLGAFTGRKSAIAGVALGLLGGAIAISMALRHLHRPAGAEPLAELPAGEAPPVWLRRLPHVLGVLALLALAEAAATRWLTLFLPGAFDMLAPLVSLTAILPLFLVAPPLVVLDGVRAPAALRRSLSLPLPELEALAVASFVLLLLDAGLSTAIAAPDALLNGPLGGLFSWNAGDRADAGGVLRLSWHLVRGWALLLLKTPLVALSYIAYVSRRDPGPADGA